MASYSAEMSHDPATVVHLYVIDIFFKHTVRTHALTNQSLIVKVTVPIIKKVRASRLTSRPR